MVGRATAAAAILSELCGTVNDKIEIFRLSWEYFRPTIVIINRINDL